MNEIKEDEFRFIAKHYKEKRLDTDKAWARLLVHTGKRACGHRKWMVAASVIMVIGIAMACAVIGSRRSVPPAPAHPTDSIKHLADSIVRREAVDSVKVFHFQDEPVNRVLNEVSQYYGKNMVASDTAKRVSGDIQASSSEEVREILEQILDITIREE